MQIVNPERFERFVAEAMAAEFAGWDFQWLEGRMLQEEPPWDYAQWVKSQFPGVQSLLDMGTGGGELLASLAPLPPDTHATEAYPPNQPIARQRLQNLGVTVHDIEEGQALPFEDDYFDLVINRHESFDPVDLHRILKPGAKFITQQVGGLDNLELNQVLEEELTNSFITWDLAEALTRLYEAGFSVSQAEKAALKSTFLDIGAVVYYLKVIPWQVAGFDPMTHHDGLIRIHNIIQRQGAFVSTAHRFLIVAQKKESP